MNTSTNTQIQSSGTETRNTAPNLLGALENIECPDCGHMAKCRRHTTRDQAMSCYGYHSGAHGANHFGANQFEAGVLVIDERFAEMFDEGATGTRAHAIEEHFSGNTVSLLGESVDRVLNAHGPCPQGMDCFGDSRPRRILECVCGFRGCAICTEAHEKSAHQNFEPRKLQTSGKEA